MENWRIGNRLFRIKQIIIHTDWFAIIGSFIIGGIFIYDMIISPNIVESVFSFPGIWFLLLWIALVFFVKREVRQYYNN